MPIDRKKWAKVTALTALALFAVIQLVPYGRSHRNPPVVAEPQWDQADTRALAVRACFDCHSNETRWPWYSHVAPFSWLVQRDVEEGRQQVNYSEWNRPFEEADESAQTVIEGSMPPRSYLWLHPSARLSEEEKERLVRGLIATFGHDTEEQREREER